MIRSPTKLCKCTPRGALGSIFMNAPPNLTTLKGGQGRPYRSHRQPACVPCRKRKARCQTSDTLEKCITCHLRGLNCFFPQGSTSTIARKQSRSTSATCTSTATSDEPSSAQYYDRSCIARSQPEIRTISDDMSQAVDQRDTNSIAVHMLTDSGLETDHVVNPMIVIDNDELGKYLAAHPNEINKSVIRTANATGRGHPMRPILFTTVIRRPLGVNLKQSESAKRCEVIEKLLEPYTHELIDLFFANANICFPVFDEPSFKKSYHENKEKISSALLANLYANALIYWNQSPKLRLKHCPDIRFVWNQANEALHSELFLSPGTSTVIAIVLNVCGRPSTSIFGNGGMIGTAVALSNALGLNRDPMSWDITAAEKSFRIRLWWLVVVHDRWCSLAYGTPLQIHRAQYDVPLPKEDDIRISKSLPGHRAAGFVFLSFVDLTEVLGKYLEHIYCISRNSSINIDTTSTNMEALLRTWEKFLDDGIRRTIVEGSGMNIPGAANLRLSYLAVKLLLSRIQLDLDGSTSTLPGPMLGHYTQAQRTAEEMVRFVQQLCASQLNGFWLPVNAFSLSSATTFLLRSSVKASNSTKTSLLENAKGMITILKEHHQKHNWDLADHCVTNCAEMTTQIEASLRDESPIFEEFQDFLQMDGSVLDEMFMQFNYNFDAFLE